MQFQSQSSHVPHVAAAATPPLVAEAAAAHGFSREAATALWQALQRGQGRMAQFEHAELGGAGQWMAGGMTMLASMGDAALRARVDALAATLAPYAERAAASVAATPPAASGRARADAWGAAAASGAQNDLKYAYYPEARRLVIEDAQGLQVYDTGMHQIQGVSQQSGQGVPCFQTAHGAVELTQLRRVADTQDTTGDGAPPAARARQLEAPDERARSAPSPATPARAAEPSAGAGSGHLGAAQTRTAQVGADAGRDAGERAEQALRLLEPLARLHQAGVLSAEEFQAKKAELLARI